MLGQDKVTGFQQSKELVYATAFWYEACRLHPSVSRNAKEAIEADVFPTGLKVNKGEFIFWSDWAIARNKQGHWGPDADVFNPDRWIDEKGALRRFTQWQFHAFNGGPRLCLGQNLATYEGVAALVAIVQNFDLQFAPGWLEKAELTKGLFNDPQPTPLYSFSLTLPMRNPMLVTVKRRAPTAPAA